MEPTGRTTTGIPFHLQPAGVLNRPRLACYCNIASPNASTAVTRSSSGPDRS
jgi:hypothetical protein